MVVYIGEAADFGAKYRAGLIAGTDLQIAWEISSGQLYTWRKQFRRGELTGFVLVSIEPEPPALPTPDPLPDPPAASTTAASLIEVELPKGVKRKHSL